MQPTNNLPVLKLIEDPSKRHVTFCKRKRGLIRKAIELSLLCGQEVSLNFFDKEQ